MVCVPQFIGGIGMRLVSVEVKNFRAYQETRRIEFDELTTIIGRNDIGKSTILEALEIFFNGDLVEMEQSDLNVRSEFGEVEITAEFTDLPEELTLDAGSLTTLSDEYLLATNGNLKIRKVFDCAKKTPSAEIFVVANHPTAKAVANLLELKEKELQALVKQYGLDVPLKGNPGMRRAIWAAAGDLVLAEIPITVSKAKEDGKRLWEQIELHLPMFALFQSDRASKDSDDEIQNPLKGAIKTAIAEVQDEIEAIQAKVRERAVEIAKLTHDALKTIDPTLASSLTPTFTPPTQSKWTGLFSVGMDTGDNIPLNKRGSGVRRLILVSFFKAEAERRLAAASKANVIYAIEEPETSQHPGNQRILIESFKEIARAQNCQVILTTHSPGLASELPVDSIRFVTSDGAGTTPNIRRGADVFGDVAETLGLTPDSRIKVLICVEGPTDIEAVKQLSRALHDIDDSLPNLLTDPRCAFVPLGGSTLKHWVSGHFLRDLRRPEIHIYDRDVADYAQSVIEINARQDGLGSWATQTLKHEIECYLHPDAIQEEFGIHVAVVDHPDAANPAVPAAFGQAYAQHRGWPNPMGDSKSKGYLTKAFKRMNAARVQARDPDGEVVGWLRTIGARMDA